MSGLSLFIVGLSESVSTKSVWFAQLKLQEFLKAVETCINSINDRKCWFSSSVYGRVSQGQEKIQELVSQENFTKISHRFAANTRHRMGSVNMAIDSIPLKVWIEPG